MKSNSKNTPPSTTVKRKFKWNKHLLWTTIPAFVCATSLIIPTVPSLIKEGKLFKNLNTSIEGTSFYSSFEDSDQQALENDNYHQPESIDNLTTATNVGPVKDSEGYNIADQVGFTGTKTFKYDGKVAIPNGDKTFSANIYKGLSGIQVGNNFVFNYKIFPTLGPNGKNPLEADLSYLSSYIAVDLLYNDSPDNSDNLQSLADTGVKDQYGYAITPKAQGESKVLYSGQWNSKEIDLSNIVGKYIHSIVLNYDNNNPSEMGKEILGYVDDLNIHAKQSIDGTHLTNYIDTRRGTNSSGDFSRGNNFPATAMPNGFNFYTPMTNSRDDWLYSYEENNDENNHPTLDGIGISHEPSPWMGDREQFNMMPSLEPLDKTTPSLRALPFIHENEIARPDYYSVTFDNGIKTEIAPASHSAIFQTTFTTDTGSIIFDSKDGNVEDFDFDATNNVLTCYVDNASGLSEGASKMYIYVQFSNQTVQDVDQSSGINYVKFDTSSNKVVQAKIATSYMSNEQAEKNLKLEILDDKLSFDDLHQRATNKWQERLKAIDLKNSNATDTQKNTLYSNLYRLNLYPNEYFENTGTNQTPIYKYVSPVKEPYGEVIKDGKMYVNNGFWDTYRTVWPAYSLLYPKFTEELVQGFLYQYRDSDFVARWSSPGHADLMTGTSSDAAFSDAYVSGAVTDLSTALNIYNSGMNDAFLDSGSNNAGRKGIKYSQFLGYVPKTDEEWGNGGGEVASWSLEGYINDYALSQMAIKLANDPNLTDQKAKQETGETKQEIKDTGNFLLRRAENFGVLFDNETGFFRGKDRDGNFILQDGKPFNPLNWGYEFTETDGWNYAFTVPFDVPGLMSLYGSQDALLNKLDEFFNTPETAMDRGSYWNIIHEMVEARDVRMGQLGMSNQPSHHIPYMYAAAGKPYKTQELTREILQRLYTGSDIGQGYCGDEDNGEMSAWYILSSLGIYDLALGSGKYIMTSPLFSKVTVNRDNGNTLTVNADNNSDQNKYISSVTLDGKKQSDVYVDQNKLLDGNHTLSFAMSSVPTLWGEKSITPVKPKPVANITNKGKITSSDDTISESELLLLTDDDSTNAVNFSTSNVNLYWKRQNELTDTDNLITNILTLTSSTADQKFNTIKILGSGDGNSWHTLATYNDSRFKYPGFTKTFSFNATKNYENYQIQLTMDNANISLAEMQLLQSDYQPYDNSNSTLLWTTVGMIIAISIAGIVVLSTTLPIIGRNTKKMKQV